MDTLTKKLKSLIFKHRRFLAYGFFGTLATSLNIATYAFMYKLLGLPNTISNIIAWSASVFVSFITAKLYVFESKSMEKKVFFTELAKFIGARTLTGFIDTAAMYIAVDVMDEPAVIVKVIVNVLVIILNYAFSRLVVFRGHHKQREKPDV